MHVRMHTYTDAHLCRWVFVIYLNLYTKKTIRFFFIHIQTQKSLPLQVSIEYRAIEHRVTYDGWEETLRCEWDNQKWVNEREWVFRSKKKLQRQTNSQTYKQTNKTHTESSKVTQRTSNATKWNRKW